MQLRDYQDYAVDSIFRYFEEGGKGNPIVAMPTGTGKSLVIAGFIKKAFALHPSHRLIKLTHVKELITQNTSKLLDLWPTAPVGVYSAGLGRAEHSFPITFAGIASVAKRAKLFGHIDTIVIDECHLVSPKTSTMYQTFISGLRKINPHLKVIGFTATAYRLGQGRLTEGDALFTDICVDMTTLDIFNWFLAEGYLSPLIPRATKTELDVEDVSIQNGEYNLKELQAAVDKDAITMAALHETLLLGSDRRKWVIYASGVAHTINVTSMLDSMGINATCVHSEMADSLRDARIEEFKRNGYQAIVNNGILTTGVDFPDLDLIVVLRPTQSTGLWVQMLGRGTRPVYAPGFDLSTRDGRKAAMLAGPKQNCLVLDFAGNTRRLGPINDPILPRRKGAKGGGQAPVRVCENCAIYCHASLTTCPNCGFVFPRAVKFGQEASTDALIRGAIEEPVVAKFQVDRVVFTKHFRQDRPPSLKASYYCGLRRFDEWVCLEHEGYPRKRARDWWRQRADNPTPPESIDEAFARLKELRTPVGIRVWVNKKHPEILHYDYTSTSGTSGNN